MQTINRIDDYDCQPGGHLHAILSRLGYGDTQDCGCGDKAAAMDAMGCTWCEENMDTVVEWLRDEAGKRGNVFVAPVARLLIRRAIKRARRESDGK